MKGEFVDGKFECYVCLKHSISILHWFNMNCLDLPIYGTYYKAILCFYDNIKWNGNVLDLCFERCTAINSFKPRLICYKVISNDDQI